MTPTPTPIPDRHVFLSYAREDQAMVDRILRALRSKGFPVFIDHDMASGVEWETVLEAQLQSAYAVVVVWSSSSVASEWVTREAAIGLAKDRLFPLLVERDVAIPAQCAGKHAADLSDWSGDPNDDQFNRAIALLQPLWEAQMGLLKEVKALKPIRFEFRPVPSRYAVEP